MTHAFITDPDTYRPRWDQLITAIETGADHFNMASFIDWTSQAVLHEQDTIVLGSCGTTGCIAGWANHLRAGGKPLFEDEFANIDTAADWLGIERTVAHRRLFLANADSVWWNLATEFDWRRGEVLVCATLTNWKQITAEQAVIVLRRILAGEILL